MTISTSTKLFTVVFGMLLTSCSWGHTEYSASEGYPAPRDGSFVLEVNDYGRFWNRDKARDVLDKISKATLKENTVLLVFVHGWHHNAKATDQNLIDFGSAIEGLEKNIVSPDFVSAREKLGVKGDIKVLGLYIGWRGESLPRDLNLLTFWGRKSAAETVGDGDLREFLWNLQKLYVKRNTAKSTFMGLVTIGHSFGGQVVFKAVTETLERDLIDVIDSTNGKHNLENKLEAQQIVSGFGDMTVLINPALEAYQYERIHRLSKQLSFLPSQAPVLLVVSAENDWPRRKLFWWGRMLTYPFRPTFPKDDQEELWLTAFGEYKPQLTHRLVPTDDPPTINDSFYQNGKISTADFTSSTILGKAVLEPNKEHRQPFSPVIVAHTSSKLVDGHSKIFGEDFLSFMTEYIAFVEGKRIYLIKNTVPEDCRPN